MERDAFREAVFARDGHQCVVPWCDHYARDAHHLLERELWDDGGYHLDNGVSLCHEHHKEAEVGTLSPDDLRRWAGITKLVQPEGFRSDVEYDKWGKVKYPRTLHLPWSYHPTRTWVQNLQSKIGWEIPEGWRICGENLAGRHAIKYRNLPSYFFAFSVWDENNICLSWDDTVAYCKMLGLELAPVMMRVTFDERLNDLLDKNSDIALSCIPSPPSFSNEIEGYVIRIADSFTYDEFSKSVAKYVRADHVDPTNTHWRRAAIETNDLL
jgi:hypothetical protein